MLLRLSSKRNALLFFNICIIFSGFIFLTGSWANPVSEEEFIKEKEEILNSLTLDYGISDKKVLQAIEKVDRRKFVPEGFVNQAYEDTRVPIGPGHGQRITLVRILAQTLQLLKLSGDEKVLEIGTGSGYQAAVIAQIAKEVYTIEIDGGLAKKAEALFDELGYSNIKVKSGDGFSGWEEFTPYDIIIVGAELNEAEIPPVLIQQLVKEGRIVVPLITGEHEEITLRIIKKVNGKVVEEWISRKDRG